MNLGRVQEILKIRSNYFVNIKNTDGDFLFKNIYYQDLADYDNDISVLLNSLKDTNDSVVVEIRSPNGSSSRIYKEVNVQLKSTTINDNQQQSTINQQQQGMSLLGNNFGLNGADIINAVAAQHENVRLKEYLSRAENALSEAKAKIEQLQSQLTDSKIKEASIDNSKPSAFDKLLESVANNPELLINVVSGLASRGTGQLNAAAAPSLTGAKQQLQSVAEEHPEQYCQLYLSIIQKFHKEPEFAELINKELKKQ